MNGFTKERCDLICRMQPVPKGAVSVPKIIENLREKLLSEARRQVQEFGYGAVTIRSVASACNVGVGTLYNYFPSKDNLIAAFMAEDWHAAIQPLFAVSVSDAMTVLSHEYDVLKQFIIDHERLFSDPAAIQTYSLLPPQRHAQFREQLAAPVEHALRESKAKDPAFLALFLVEALLTWTLSGIDKDPLFTVLAPLLAADDRKEAEKGEQII